MLLARWGPASPQELAALQERLKKATSKAEHRRVEAVGLYRRHRMKPADIAESVGFDRSHVYALLAAYRRHGVAALGLQPRGGRRNAHMTVREEAELLEGLKAKAEKGGVLVVAEVKAAYEERLGRSVPESTVHAMLHRHGWRKLQPRPRHREAEPAAQEDSKKNLAAVVEATVQEQAAQGRPVRLMFQDEARFGLISDRAGAWPRPGCAPLCRPRSCASTRTRTAP